MGRINYTTAQINEAVEKARKYLVDGEATYLGNLSATDTLNRVTGELRETTDNLDQDIVAHLGDYEKLSGQLADLDSRLDSEVEHLWDGIGDVEVSHKRLIDGLNARVEENAGSIDSLNELLRDKADAQDTDVKFTEVRQEVENVRQKAEAARVFLAEEMFLRAIGDSGWGRIEHGRHTDGEEDRPYFLNNIWLTLDEMLDVMSRYHTSPDKSGQYAECRCRTNMPFLTRFQASAKGFAYRNGAMETALLTGIIDGSLEQAFAGCVSLRECTIERISGCVSAYNCFSGCRSLQELRIGGLDFDLSLAWSPLISVESLQDMITRRQGTAPITLTLHPDVYDRMFSGKADEWTALPELAADMNVSLIGT